jgi:hypothetical protein
MSRGWKLVERVSWKSVAFHGWSGVLAGDQLIHPVEKVPFQGEFVVLIS